jgi:hypothetical protein
LLVSPRQLAKRVKVLPVEVREFLEARVVVVDHLAEAVAEVVGVQPEVAVVLVVYVCAQSPRYKFQLTAF